MPSRRYCHEGGVIGERPVSDRDASGAVQATTVSHFRRSISRLISIRDKTDDEGRQHRAESTPNPSP